MRDDEDSSPARLGRQAAEPDSQHREPAPRRRLFRPALGALLAYLAMAFVVTNATWSAPTSRWVGGCCDPEQTIWFLRWVPFALTHGLNVLFTPLLNAPDGVNLMWNASVPFWGLVTWPINELGGPILAYNVALTCAIVGSAWLAFLAMRRYASSPLGPFLAGAMYGFSSYVIPHAALHLNLATAWAPPLFLMVLDDLLVRRRGSPLRHGAVLGVIAAFQLLMAEELLFTCVIAAGVLVLVLAACRPSEIRDGLRRLVPALASATLTFLVVAGGPLVLQFFGPQRIHGSVTDPEAFSTDLLNLVLPTPYELLAPDFATSVSRGFSGLYHEANAYLGVPLLLLIAGLAWLRWGDLRVRVPLLVGAILLVCSLGPTLHVGGDATGIPAPWALVASLPVAENVVPSRLAVFAWLAAAVLLTVAVDAALSLPRLTKAGVLGLAAASLAFMAPAPLGASSTAVPAFFTDWPRQGIEWDETVLVAPYFRNGAGADPMVWAAFAGDAVRMPEAYAYVPRDDGTASYGPPDTQLSQIMEKIQDSGHVVVARASVRDQVARDLRDFGIVAVVVGPMRHHDQMVAFFEDLFGRPPEDVDGVQIWRDVASRGVAAPPP